MKGDLPDLREFRLEPAPSGVVHLVFDTPNRSMNVFSEAAIAEMAAFADWLATADVAGVVVRSAKPAFCAGADLTELGVAYDMIMAQPKAVRSEAAFSHFFRLSRALRALETAGKPVAAAVAGLALGGGCELVLACHHRVLIDAPQVALGLPESLVGLMQGAGGTQRLPRLIGLEAALPVLLEGARLSPAEALRQGLTHEVVRPGDEVEAAERWVLTAAAARQPWDKATWKPAPTGEISGAIRQVRRRILAQTHGHYPALLAILDCLEQGLPLAMDQAIRAEMIIFSGLIQRPEPRNMIQSLFLGRLDHDRRLKSGALAPSIEAAVQAVSAALCAASQGALAGGAQASKLADALEAAGFTRPVLDTLEPAPAPSQSVGLSARGRESADLWFEHPPRSPSEVLARPFVFAAAAAAAACIDRLEPSDRRVADYAAVTRLGFPAYLGGPLALAEYLGRERIVAGGGVPA